MPGLTVRDFECTLCQKQFTLLAGDLMLPGPDLCDECLREVWPLQGQALAELVTQRLPDEEQERVNGVIQYIQWHKEQWKSSEEAIGNRERERNV